MKAYHVPYHFANLDYSYALLFNIFIFLFYFILYLLNIFEFRLPISNILSLDKALEFTFKKILYFKYPCEQYGKQDCSKV
jgi:hypothetical protein